MANKQLLTTIIHTKNSELNLKKCLESIKWSDEILIVDSGSTDQTLKIAADYQCHIIPVKDFGYVEPARSIAIDKANGEWILIIDSDEYLPIALQQQIPLLISDLHADVYWLARQNWIFGKWIEHSGWWPDYLPRLFRKGMVNWGTEIHSKPAIKGKEVYTPADPIMAIIHENYPSIDLYLEKLINYTSIQATEIPKISAKKGDFSSISLMNQFSGEFLSRYFKKDGWKDNSHGLVLSLLQSMYQLIIKIKVWQNQGFKTEESTSDAISPVEGFKSDLAFWIADWHIQHSEGIEKWWWMFRRKLKL